MQINWSGIWNWIKFHLGMVCVAEFDGKWVITRTTLGLTYCLDRDSNYWWSEGYWNRNCTFNTREEAEMRRQRPEPEERYIKPRLRACK